MIVRSGHQSGLQPFVMKTTRKQLLAPLPKYEEAMSSLVVGNAKPKRQAPPPREAVSPSACEESEDMDRMKESLDDTMRTIQEMRLMQNVQEEEGGQVRLHTQSPLVNPENLQGYR